MDNYIILGIVIIIVAVGVISTVKHFRGEGGCCSGGSYTPKRKKLKSIKYQKAFHIDGMTCEHCKRRVEEAVNDIKGVSARVILKKSELIVSYADDVNDNLIKEKIERAGYSVVD